VWTEEVLKLHRYIATTHWDGNKLAGPDPIGRIHWRITRFIRSYLRSLPGDDRYAYLQAQAYWIRANLKLLQASRDPGYSEFVLPCADYILSSQRGDGSWIHPPIWGRRGFVSTVEGVWASLGLTAVYQETGRRAYLDGALRWYEFQMERIGFQEVAGGLATNYYAHSTRIVPNVTTMLIWFLAELFQITRDAAFLELTEPMIRFLQHSQLSTGELPYELGTRTHYLCYQYNSFEFLDLAHYYQITGNEQVRPLMSGMAEYLATGITERGSCRQDCFKEFPEVNYWTASLATALRKAHEFELGDYFDLSERSYRYLLTQQRPDGGFDFSERNYRLLRDQRSYPRYLAMILDHLMEREHADI
jgi:uncharacterized protein YyaL (SSP411 family)